MLLDGAMDDSSKETERGLEVGDEVLCLPGCLPGTVRYIGESKFAPGEWIGVELKKAKGKNDGSVNGIAYFKCNKRQGVFLRRSAILSAACRTEQGGENHAQILNGNLRFNDLADQRSDRETSSDGEFLNQKHDADAVTAFAKLASKLSQPGFAQKSRSTSGSSKTPDENEIADQTVEELIAKIRILEKKLIRDRAVIKSYEKATDNLQVSPKNEPVLPQQLEDFITELDRLKLIIRDLETAKMQLSERLAESERRVELVTLDRDIAEEEKRELIELQMGNFKNIDFSEIDYPELAPDLRQRNEVLSKALIKLKEMFDQREKQLLADPIKLHSSSSLIESERVKRLEDELDIRQRHIEHLTKQLDARSMAEKIIERLTVENLAQCDKIKQLDELVKTLESINELNEELVENQTWSVTHLQKEIVVCQKKLHAQSANISRLEGFNNDYKLTFLRFREVVIGLQHELNHAHEAITSNRTSKEYLPELKLSYQDVSGGEKLKLASLALAIQNVDLASVKEHLSIIRGLIPPALEFDQSIAVLFSLQAICEKSSLAIQYLRSITFSASLAYSKSMVVRQSAIYHLSVLWSTCTILHVYFDYGDLDEFDQLYLRSDDITAITRSFANFLTDLKVDNIDELKINEIRRGITVANSLIDKYVVNNARVYPQMLKLHLEKMNETSNSVAEVCGFWVVILRKLKADFNSGEVIRLLEQLRVFAYGLSTTINVGKESLQLLEQDSKTWEPENVGKLRYLAEEYRQETSSNLEVFGNLIDAVDKTFNESDMEKKMSFIISALRGSIQDTNIGINDILRFYDQAFASPKYVQLDRKDAKGWIIKAGELASAGETIARLKEQLVNSLNDRIDLETDLQSEVKMVEELKIRISFLEKRLAKLEERETEISHLKICLEESRQQSDQSVALIKELEAKLAHCHLNEKSATVLDTPSPASTTTRKDGLTNTIYPKLIRDLVEENFSLRLEPRRIEPWLAQDSLRVNITKSKRKRLRKVLIKDFIDLARSNTISLSSQLPSSASSQDVEVQYHLLMTMVKEENR